MSSAILPTAASVGEWHVPWENALGMSAPRPQERQIGWLRWSAVAAVYAVLALLYARSLVGHLASVLPNDVGDPGLLTWSLWWNAQALPLTDRWWNAPMFSPLAGAFALSETLLGIAPITTPLVWAGVPPVAVYNVTYVFSFVAAALAAHVLAWRLTGRHDAAFIAGLAYGFSPYRAAQIPHLQVLASWWMPCALVFLHAYLTRGRRRALAGFGVCWMLNGLTNGYFLMYFAVLAGLWVLWFARSGRQWGEIGVATVVASLPWIPIIAGYGRIQGGLGLERTRGEIEAFSADLSAFWASSPNAWLPAHWTFTPRAEGELYPGAVILGLTLVAGALAWRQRGAWLPRGRRVLAVIGAVALGTATLVWLTGGASGSIGGVPISVTRPHRLVGIGLWLIIAAVLTDPRIAAGWRRQSVFLFYVLATAAMAAFALGPVWRAFDARFMDRAPYFWLMQLPGGSALRVPARFGMLFVLCLSQAAALGFARLGIATATSGARLAAPLLLGALIVAEGWIPTLPLASVPPGIDLAGLPSAAAVLEVPTRDMWDDTPAMIRAMAHGRPVVNGFSGYVPPHYGPLQLGLRTFDPTPVMALRQHGPLLIVVNTKNDGDGKWLAFVRSLPDVRAERKSAIGPVFSFTATTPPPVPGGAPLAVAAIEATSNSGEVLRLTDGKLDTFWQTAAALAEGDEVRLTLDRPSLVRRLELDLGTRTMEYPPLVRVAAADTDQPPEVVWEGRVAGLSMAGALLDPRRTTVAINLPGERRAHRLWITAAAPNPEGFWAVAELRVIGEVATVPPLP